MSCVPEPTVHRLPRHSPITWFLGLTAAGLLARLAAMAAALP